MKRHTLYVAAGTVIFALVVVAVIVSTRRADNGAARDDTDPRVTATRFSADSKHNRTVRAAIQRGGVSFHDDRGVNINLDHEYVPGTPLIEILTFARDLDGQIRPLKVESLNIDAGLPRSGSGGSGVDGFGVLMPLNPKGSPKRGLQYDTAYRVRASYVPAEGQKLVDTRDCEVTFKTPSHLDQGELYHVELIVLDKPLVEEKRREEERARQTREQKVQEETIVVNAEYPDTDGATSWVAAYWSEGSSREGYDRQANGRIAIPGPNPLQGELLVLMVDASGRAQTWCYIRNLQKRTVTLPGDADVVVVAEKLVELDISFQASDSDELNAHRTVSFYVSPSARVPLFGLPLRHLSSPAPDSPNHLSLKVLPGVYYVRVGTPTEEELAVGTVSVNVVGPNRFTVELPNEPLSRQQAD